MHESGCMLPSASGIGDPLRSLLPYRASRTSGLKWPLIPPAAGRVEVFGSDGFTLSPGLLSGTQAGAGQPSPEPLLAARGPEG